MKHLTILVPEGENNLSSMVGPYKILTKANEYWQSRGNKKVFKIQLAGNSKNIELYDGLFSVRPHAHISAIKKTDFIIIPSLNHAYRDALKINQPMIDWIVYQYGKGAEVASICTGAFMLAATGLLDNKTCSTHWVAATVFRSMFPSVQVVTESVVTDEDGIYTNGGAYSFLNLLLYLIEKYYDRQTAVYCAKVFQIDIDRSSQSPFSIFNTQKDHKDEMVKKAQQAIESKLDSRLSVAQLAHQFAVSRRNFDRRFLRATGNTPGEYQQRVKIEAAKRSFESSNKNVNEVMFDVGYNDIKAFRTIFKKITGLAPIEYRDKYNKIQFQ